MATYKVWYIEDLQARIPVYRPAIWNIQQKINVTAKSHLPLHLICKSHLVNESGLLSNKDTQRKYIIFLRVSWPLHEELTGNKEKNKPHLAHTLLPWNLNAQSLNRFGRKCWKKIFPKPHSWDFKQLLSLRKSINRSKFSIIPAALNTDCMHKFSVLIAMNIPYNRSMSSSGCHTWTNVGAFTQCTRGYQGI